MKRYKHIDLELLKQISDGRVELVSDLVKMFTSQVPVFVQQLYDLYNKQDYLALGKLAHKIKGSASTLGITEIALDMKHLENNVNKGIDIEKFNLLVDKFKSICTEGIEELNDYINRL